jgi:hypothetical protein
MDVSARQSKKRATRENDFVNDEKEEQMTRTRDVIVPEAKSAVLRTNVLPVATPLMRQNIQVMYHMEHDHRKVNVLDLRPELLITLQNNKELDERQNQFCLAVAINRAIWTACVDAQSGNMTRVALHASTMTDVNQSLRYLHQMQSYDTTRPSWVSKAVCLAVFMSIVSLSRKLRSLYPKVPFEIEPEFIRQYDTQHYVDESVEKTSKIMMRHATGTQPDTGFNEAILSQTKKATQAFMDFVNSQQNPEFTRTSLLSDMNGFGIRFADPRQSVPASVQETSIEEEDMKDVM